MKSVVITNYTMNGTPLEPKLITLSGSNKQLHNFILLRVKHYAVIQLTKDKAAKITRLESKAFSIRVVTLSTEPPASKDFEVEHNPSNGLLMSKRGDEFIKDLHDFLGL